MNQPPLLPLKDFFKNPDVAYFTLSPDGNQIAFTKPYKNRMNIFVSTLGSKDTTQITFLEDRDVAGYFWKGNKRLLYSKDKGGDENFHIYAVDADGKNEKELTPFEHVRAQVVDDLEDNEDEILVGLNKENPELFDVYSLNIHTGDLKMQAKNPGGVSSWVTDHKGVIRIAVQTDGVRVNMLYRPDEKTPFKSVLSTDFKTSVSPLFFTFDNQYLYASSNLGRDKSAIVIFDIAKGVEKEVIYTHPDVDVSDLSYSRKRKVLTSISYTFAKTEKKILDAETEKIYKDLEAQLGTEKEIHITGHNKAEDKLLIRTMSDRSLGSSYLYDVAAKKLTKLADRAPWLKEENLAEMKPIQYTTRDGLTIHGYLTLPQGGEGKNLPVVINPHGGPWARDAWGYNSEVQFLANRGYAVLQMNFRGSVGFGRQFWESSFKQWGKTMQDDISDGVNYLVKEGIADKHRIAIYGGSYGGYATLAGITFTPDVYACAIDYVGVSNLFTFMKTIPPYWKPYLEMMHEMVGDPEKDTSLMHDASPVFFVDRIKCPLLIAQGAKDPRVNKDESDQIVKALKERHISVEYIVKENEGHGFHNEENRFEFYRAMEAFLAQHIHGRKENK